MRLGRAGKKQDVFDDALEASDFVADNLSVFIFLGAWAEMFLLNKKPRLDGGKRVADFVGDAGGQHTEGSEFLLSFHDDLAFNELDAQRSDEIAINHNGQSSDGQQEQGEGGQQQKAQMLQRFV